MLPSSLDVVSVLWSDELKFEILFRNNLCHALLAKEERKHLACYARTVQKLGSVMAWACISAHIMSNLHLCEGTINDEPYNLVAKLDCPQSIAVTQQIWVTAPLSYFEKM